MTRFSLVILLTYLYLGQASANDTIRYSNPKKFTPGFNYNLQLAYFEISPTINFPVHKRVSPGIGLNYIHYYRTGHLQGRNSMAANIFTRIYASDNIFFHTEYLFSRVPYLHELTYEFYPVSTSSFFIGAGYRQLLYKDYYAYLTVLADLAHTPYSAFRNKILFRLSFTF
ncbi:MAG: hypothetical protein ACK4ND_01150 [Cytophagaceae bacterium]